MNLSPQQINANGQPKLPQSSSYFVTLNIPKLFRIKSTVDGDLVIHIFQNLRLLAFYNQILD